jgi:hypothetical protein
MNLRKEADIKNSGNTNLAGGTVSRAPRFEQFPGNHSSNFWMMPISKKRSSATLLVYRGKDD